MSKNKLVDSLLT
ncbi:unnamed protein product, partial [Vitis vinifera]|uniref:Uncharacterized protein n=1 Tax=Vitis vinifera TaxID=29760 RepID=D7THH2_VITVI